MRRPIAFGLLAVLAATLAAIVVYSALQRREVALQKAVASSVEIVVAARDLPIGTRIEAGAVKLARWSRDSMPPGSMTDLASAIGGVVKDRFGENEPLVADKLFSGQKSGGVLPLLIPAGMRAMSVAVDEVSDVSGFILPGSKVDVLVSLMQTQGNQKPFSKLVLQDVSVLAVAQQLDNGKDEPQLVKVVTLLLAPDEAERLGLAASEGVLRLALRNYTDNKIVLTSGVDTDSILSSYRSAPMMVAQSQSPIARAPTAPVPEAQVEIMRDGKRREVVSFLKGARVLPGESREEPAPAANPPSPPSPSDRGFSNEGNSGHGVESSPGDPAGDRGVSKRKFSRTRGGWMCHESQTNGRNQIDRTGIRYRGTDADRVRDLRRHGCRSGSE